MDIEAIYTTLTEADVDRYVAEGQEEHLHLDFKTFASADFTSSDDKKNLARALSGFANSSGGIIVWGVDARKNAQGVDCAVAKRPIPMIARVVGRLNEYTGSSVSPIVDGIRHRAIADAAGDGFAITIVPESHSGPHMAKMSEDRYFKRSGDRFYRMEHFDLEDMFGRRQRPKLRLHTRTVPGGSIGGGGQTQYKAKLVLGIENAGRGLAKTPYLEFEVEPPYNVDRGGLDGNFHEGLPRVPVAGGRAIRYGGSADNVIHPTLVLDIAAVELTAVSTHKLELVMPRPLMLRYTIAAEGAKMVTGTFEMSSRDIALATYPESLHEGVPIE